MMALGICLNIPFAILGWIFDYPQILRQPAGEILARFDEGGILLLAVWYAFALAAPALLIFVGLVEGFSTVQPFDPGFAGVAAPAGFIVLSVWMVIAGFSLSRRNKHGAERE